MGQVFVKFLQKNVIIEDYLYFIYALKMLGGIYISHNNEVIFKFSTKYFPPS